jgi:hypothetical protein
VTCRETSARYAQPLSEAQRFASADMRRAFRLQAFDSAHVRLITDPQICQRIGDLLEPVRDTSRSSAAPASRKEVIVVALGLAGYWVHPAHLWHTAGEFLCDAVLVDRDIKTAAWLCG